MVQAIVQGQGFTYMVRGRYAAKTLLVCINWSFLYLARVSRHSLDTAQRVLFSPLLLQLEELKKQSAESGQNIVDLKCELEEKRFSEISALKESHQGEMAELESRLKGKHDRETALLRQQYQVWS